jgi:signal transduction histidine kinase
MKTFVRRIGPLLLIVGVPIVLLAHVLVRDALSRAEENAKSRILSQARLGAYAVNEYVRGTVEYTEAYSRRQMLIDACRRRDGSSARAILREFAECNSRIDRVFIADSKGVLWSDYPEAPEVLNRDFSKRDWFQGAIRKRTAYVSHSYVRSAEPQRICLAVASPVMDGQGTVVAILVGQILVDSLTRELQTATGSSSGHMVLFDREGRQCGMSSVDAPSDVTPDVISIPEGGTVVMKALRANGESWITAFGRVPSTGGAVLAARPLGEAVNGTRSLATTIYILSILFAFGVTWGVSRLLEYRDRRIEALQKEEERQRALSEKKSEFVAYLAHEIRSPLTAILGFADLILSGNEGDVPGPVTRDLEIVRERTQFILSLVSDLLDTTKIEAGRMETHADVFPPGRVARKIAASFEPICLKRGLAMKISVDEPEPMAFADPRLIEQVLSNLLSNALKFTREGEIRVDIQGGSETCTVRVSDTGLGMGSEDLARIFERYATLDQHRNAVQRDTGLGLYLSKQLVELQGGTLTVESEKARGTTVTFTLPTPRAAKIEQR